MSIPFGRTGLIRINIDNSSDWQEYRNIDFKFNIEKTVGGNYIKGVISIFGLSWDTICNLTTWTVDGWNLAKNIRIQVFAGYGEAGYKTCIFDGNIINAVSTMPPNICLNILAYSQHTRSFEKFDGTIGEDKELPFKEAMKKMADMIESDIDFSRAGDIDNSPVRMRVFPAQTTYKTVFEYMWTMAQSKGLMMYEDIQHESYKSIIYLCSYAPPSDAQLEQVKRDHTISAENGMIGIPKISFSDVEVQTLLDTSIDRSAFIYLDSKYVPDDKFSGADGLVNGFYMVNSIHHVGHLRGPEWYTTIKAYRYGEQKDGKMYRFGIKNKDV